MAWSVPYAGAQFGLLVPNGTRDVHSLTDLGGKRVGIVAGTVALSEKDHSVVRFKTREDLLNSFAGASLDAAFVDADFAAWFLHGHPQLGLRLVTEYTPRERWNMALAVRARDSQLIVELNRALAQLAESGELRRVYAEHGVPFRPPFTASAQRPATADAWQQISKRRQLVVSMDPANLPYSSARVDRPGFDVELAHALADQLRVELRIDWLDIHHETAVGRLLKRECDLVFGEAVAPNIVADEEELAGKVLYSRPYYGTGYVLVRRKAGPHVRSLRDFQGANSQRLGAEAGSVADYNLRQKGFLRRLYRNQLATLKALSDGDLDAAYLWANVGWTLHTSPDSPLEIVPDYVPEDHWNIAVAMSAGNGELKRHVDEALDRLMSDGTVARALDRYHVPHHAPFEERLGAARGSAEAPIHHAVANRGPEPRMQKITTSRHPYSALSRVHSAGELVVGLDPNNLPFSAAYPQPAGLDHEIAGLLAAQLGVRLRVYWAYSAHDSYPSKLAARQLCDVILGVMPDDRFGQRVLFSRPYHIAKYLLVVRRGASQPAATEPLAVEEGVAVRGMKGHEARFYPSTEAVLEAVVKGRANSGYVISTRGQWLAAQRWPGCLTFCPASPFEAADCFPICAAVRKTDSDLKDAIDQAWGELERSGRLAQVFARWHLPYEIVAVSDESKATHP